MGQSSRANLNNFINVEILVSARANPTGPPLKDLWSNQME